MLQITEATQFARKEDNSVQRRRANGETVRDHNQLAAARDGTLSNMSTLQQRGTAMGRRFRWGAAPLPQVPLSNMPDSLYATQNRHFACGRR